MSRTTGTRRKRMSIDKNTEVVVTNNTYGMFVWESKNGETSIELQSYGDEEFITYGELRKLKKYLTNMDLVITSVEDDDISIVDVARGLRIDKVYEEYFDLIEDVDIEDVDSEAEIDIQEFEDFILDSHSDEYETALKGNLKHIIINLSVDLYKQRKLSDREKTRLLLETRPKKERGDFLNDIEASLEAQLQNKRKGTLINGRGY